jgi:hypothetical protein
MCDLSTLDSATPEDASVLSDLLELYQFELRTIFALARGPDAASATRAYRATGASRRRTSRS